MSSTGDLTSTERFAVLNSDIYINSLENQNNLAFALVDSFIEDNGNGPSRWAYLCLTKTSSTGTRYVQGTYDFCKRGAVHQIADKNFEHPESYYVARTGTPVVIGTIPFTT